VLSGSAETHNLGKDAFQEMDAISLLTPYTKLARRPAVPENIPKAIKDGYRQAMYGKPGPAFIDLPANLILGQHDVERQKLPRLIEAPKSVAPQSKIRDIVQVLKNAKAPLVVIGKGAAYARAEDQIRSLIDQCVLNCSSASVHRAGWLTLPQNWLTIRTHTNGQGCCTRLKPEQLLGGTLNCYERG